MTHDEGVPALRADRLGKRYGRVWGLRDCTFSVPAGSVVGLVGPNGAGKTTLLSLTVGLLAPTEGEIVVFGETSRAHTADTLARVSYLAQDRPLYGGFTVADMFHFGRSMNPRWDQTLAQARVDPLGIPLQRKVKALSGGQQAQVALTMALAKRAPLLALDEPVASLIRSPGWSSCGHARRGGELLQRRGHARGDLHRGGGPGGCRAAGRRERQVGPGLRRAIPGGRMLRIGVDRASPMPWPEPGCPRCGTTSAGSVPATATTCGPEWLTCALTLAPRSAGWPPGPRACRCWPSGTARGRGTPPN